MDNLVNMMMIVMTLWTMTVQPVVASSAQFSHTAQSHIDPLLPAPSVTLETHQRYGEFARRPSKSDVNDKFSLGID